MRFHIAGLVGLLMISSCMVPAALYGTMRPYVSQDGRQLFRYVVTNTNESAHKDMIAAELGRRQYCMSGWNIISADPTADRKFVVYEGACSPPKSSAPPESSPPAR